MECCTCGSAFVRPAISVFCNELLGPLCGKGCCWQAHISPPLNTPVLWETMSAGGFWYLGRRTMLHHYWRWQNLPKEVLTFWDPDCMEQLSFNQASHTNPSATLMDLKFFLRSNEKGSGKTITKGLRAVLEVSPLQALFLWIGQSFGQVKGKLLIWK